VAVQADPASTLSACCQRLNNRDRLPALADRRERQMLCRYEGAVGRRQLRLADRAGDCRALSRKSGIIPSTELPHVGNHPRRRILDFN